MNQHHTQQAPNDPVLQQMKLSAQKRLAALMVKNTEGQISATERVELAALVVKYEQIMLANSEMLWQLTPSAPVSITD